MAEQTALGFAIEALRKKDLFESETRTLLTERGFLAADVDPAIQRLRSQGVLNDMRLASRLANNLANDKRWGDGRIRAQLNERGADPQTIEQVVTELAPEPERAQSALYKAHKTSPASAARYLAARGFDEYVVQEALERLIEAVSGTFTD